MLILECSNDKLYQLVSQEKGFGFRSYRGWGIIRRGHLSGKRNNALFFS